MFRRDLLRAYLSPGFVASILLVFFASTYEIWNAIFDTIFRVKAPWGFLGTNSLHAFHLMTRLSMLVFLLPLACVLPFGVSITDEACSGQMRLLIYRVGRKRYLVTRLLSVSISGGSACAAVVLLIAVFARVAFPLEYGEVPSEQNLLLMKSNILYQTVSHYLPSVFYSFAAWNVVMAFVGGCIWSAVSVGISIWFPNRYFAMAAPIVFYCATAMLFGMIGAVVPAVYPYMLFSDFANIPTWPGQVFLRLGWLGLGVLLYTLGGRRLLRNV